MNWDTHDLICAIASPPGGAARGVVRLSGPETVATVVALFRPRELTQKLESLKQAVAVEGTVCLSRLARHVPAMLYLWPTSRSYTCQPLAEFHTLGSPPLLEAMVEELLAHGARMALPGEFTLRAFLGGRIDLAQAEAVLGVIDAQTPEQLQTALAQLAGGLSRHIQSLRDQLLELCAHLEAGLDFVEEDLAFLTAKQLSDQLAAIRRTLGQLLDHLQSRSAQQPTYRAVLVGRPNAGKSSLLNALAGRPAALVSPHAGTTRDFVTCPLEIAGANVELIDTAGIDPFTNHGTEKAVTQPRDAIEKRSNRDPSREILERAQQRSRQQAHQADVVLLCVDSTGSLNEDDRAELARADARRIAVLTKCDLTSNFAWSFDAVRTSAVNAQGLDELKRRIAVALGIFPDTQDTDVNARGRGQQVATTQAALSATSATAARCRDSLCTALEAIERALDTAQQPHTEELVAAEVRISLHELGKIVGVIYTDDILDRIFSRFCIGK